LIIAGIEIYSSKQGLEIQRKEKWFTEYESKVKREELYARDEELSVWYPRGGFTGREGRGGERGFVLLARFECKNVEGREKVVGVLR
jgi:hypothetical protein